MYSDMFAQVYARTTNSEATHSSFGPIKQLAAQVSYLLPGNVQLFGENMFGVHSIEYDGLSSFFYIFAVLEEGRDWWSWDKVVQLADEIGVPTVPVVYRGQVSVTVLLYVCVYVMCGHVYIWFSHVDVGGHAHVCFSHSCICVCLCSPWMCACVHEDVMCVDACTYQTCSHLHTLIRVKFSTTNANKAIKLKIIPGSFLKRKIFLKKVENPGIDPGTSRMLSERSTT